MGPRVLPGAPLHHALYMIDRQVINRFESVLGLNMNASTAIAATSIPVRPDALGHVVAEVYSSRLIDRLPVSAERCEAKTHCAE